jgi:hypothetical protein
VRRRSAPDVRPCCAKYLPAGDWRLQVADRVSDFDQYKQRRRRPLDRRTGAEEPAPQVSVTAAQPEGGAPASTGGNTAKSQPATQAADIGDKASKGVGIVALVLGGLGLLLGAAALVVAAGRRRTATPA